MKTQSFDSFQKTPFLCEFTPNGVMFASRKAVMLIPFEAFSKGIARSEDNIITIPGVEASSTADAYLEFDSDIECDRAMKALFDAYCQISLVSDVKEQPCSRPVQSSGPWVTASRRNDKVSLLRRAGGAIKVVVLALILLLAIMFLWPVEETAQVNMGSSGFLPETSRSAPFTELASQEADPLARMLDDPTSTSSVSVFGNPGEQGAYVFRPTITMPEVEMPDFSCD